MSKQFVTTLVDLWELHKKGQKEREQPVSEAVFRHRMTTNARLMFGDVAETLDWEVTYPFGEPAGRVFLMERKVTLEYSPDYTGLYVFFAWTSGYDDKPVKHHIDGRLKLAALLYDTVENS